MDDVRQMAERFRGKTGREVFKDSLLALGQKNEKVVVVGADSFRSLGGDTFQREFPERSVNIGIAEQNAVGLAAGLALQGKTPLVLLFGFTIARALEQIRVSICYPELNVKIVTNATGLDMGEGGVTHHCTEDIGMMRTLANMTIVQPGSPLEVAFATNAIVEQVDGPCYLRHTRQHYPQEAEQALESFYLNGGEFQVGQAITLCDGVDVALIGSGLTVGLALQIATLLEKKGISARVLNMHTIKPLDVKAILDSASNTQIIITLEDHNILGGLGEAVSGIVSENRLVRVLRVGIHDVYCEIGPPNQLYKHHGLCPEKVAEQVENILCR